MTPEKEEWLESMARKIYGDLVENHDWDNVLYYEVLNKVREVYEKAKEDAIEEVLDDPYKHELVPMDSARDWVADNYAPRY